jgi:hypothetical protein
MRVSQSLRARAPPGEALSSERGVSGSPGPLEITLSKATTNKRTPSKSQDE